METSKTKLLRKAKLHAKKEEENKKEEFPDTGAISAEAGTMIEASSRYQKYLSLTKKKIVMDKSQVIPPSSHPRRSRKRSRHLYTTRRSPAKTSWISSQPKTPSCT